MSDYPKYATTVIGAHSVPDWFESLDRLVAVGQLSMASFADAQFRTSEAAILEQELAGIDVVTSGEMNRRTHNRHSPPMQCSTTSGRRFQRSRGARGRSRSHFTTSMFFIPRPLAGPAFSTTLILAWSTNTGWLPP